jgi:hypothetical protein
MVRAVVSPGCLARLSGVLPVHSLGLREVFSLQLAEVRTVFSWTQLSRTHTLMSYAETIFEDLRKAEEIKN